MRQQPSLPGSMNPDRNGGSALVVVLAIILTMLVLGNLFLRIMGSETQMSENLATRTQAIYLAESGAHVGIVWLQDNPNWPVVLPKAPDTLTLSAGSITYQIDTAAVPNQARVLSRGQVGLSERTIEVRVSK